MKRLVFTVTNDLAFDQRMIRICGSLASAGYDVLLIGRKHKHSPGLAPKKFKQKRLPLFFKSGKWFYIEYNIRLFFSLLFTKAHLICAIDLDTILPVLYASKIKRCKRVYDAHELFCEMKEVVTRPRIYAFWKWVEQKAVPQFRLGYTVNVPIRDIFKRDYKVNYEVIQNAPLMQDSLTQKSSEDFIIYQGAVNEGRSFETLIPAFKWIDMPLHIYGDGNFLLQAENLIKQHGLEQKVLLKGKALPETLRHITPKAAMGITLFENKGLSNYYSLANRFFDYMHAGVPQLCVDYPVYRNINDRFKVAVLITDLSPENIAASINNYLNDTALQQQLRLHCLQARKIFNWQAEEKNLLSFYKNAFE